MKLLTLNKNGQTSLGVQTSKGIIDIEKALTVVPSESEVPTDVMQVIERDASVRENLSSYIDKVLTEINDQSKFLTDESAITFAPVVSRPNKIICVGLNYKKHAEETNAPIPEYPILFNKFNNSLTGHHTDVQIPNVTEKLDYEAELGIVIGNKAKNVSKESALDYVFGYCNVNDLSARDLQLRTPQWLLGKTSDGFCPVGPHVVTSDEVGDPNNLEIKSIVNGEVRQNSNTSDMIFHCDEIVSYISQYMTLEPGDLILTGTPEGVVMGYPPEEQNYLSDGDTVTIEIEKLGKLTNTFIAE